ncbi:MAG: hypothetical protein Q4B60_06555 [Erysipelotrichaceae bacterium]|nr:hypothetical protein [Erysipelotrichaceae bacterium]
MLHTVISYMRIKNGQNCLAEMTFENKDRALNYVNRMNELYGETGINWVLDSYKI